MVYNILIFYNQFEQGTSTTVRNNNEKFERIYLFFYERECHPFFIFM
jgi:hypothetical protein